MLSRYHVCMPGMVKHSTSLQYYNGMITVLAPDYTVVFERRPAPELPSNCSSNNNNFHKAFILFLPVHSTFEYAQYFMIGARHPTSFNVGLVCAHASIRL
jgi:hypothetical protein